ncbi:hypothetical protein CRENBAI_007612 [Crenichthys baileyi]|uniref:Uncharacterized protein n=1 Tax=Crenichthys baileyi TaxID=28760 RepID=A0AAV9SIY8_9TELE
MARTFAYRRQEVVNEEPGVDGFKDRWPALFQQKEINAEFQRLVALPLEQTFMTQLDSHSSQLITVVEFKGGATHAKMAGIMKTYDEGRSGDDAEMELQQLSMAVFVIRKEGEGLKEPPEDIGIVIEGVDGLHDLTSVASAWALLLGLIYALNLANLKPLRFTFEVFQKIFSNTRCLPKFRICLEAFRAHSKEMDWLFLLIEQKSSRFWKLNKVLN